MSRTDLVKIEGDDELIRRLQKAVADYPNAGAQALFEEGQGVDANMVPRIPVDTGRLRATHYVAPPTQDGKGFVVEVGVATDYAPAVHERTEVPHKTGEAKFLENALHAQADGMGQRLAKRIEDLAAKGGGVPILPTKPPPSPPPTNRFKPGKEHKGSRGGRFHYSRNGRKVYHRRKGK